MTIITQEPAFGAGPALAHRRLPYTDAFAAASRPAIAICAGA